VHARRVRQPGDETRADRRPSRPASAPARRRSTSRAATRSDFLAPDDVRRSAAAAASALLPGVGQLINGRTRLAKWFALPVLILLALAILKVATSSPTRLFASVVSPTAMGTLLVLNVVLLGWRLAAVMQAFFDGRYPGRSGRAGASALALLLIAVVVPHGIANAWGLSAQSAFASVFVGEHGSGPGLNVAAGDRGPGHDERLNILVVGIDKTPWRTATLTDSLMVISIDPVGETASIVSLPRDIIKVPLGNGDTYGPKINSLMSYADKHPDKFPQGGMRALEDAVGALLDIPIHYYAKIDFFGFTKLVSAVGGVDINVKKAFYDPRYDGIGVNMNNKLGWGVTVGLHHFNGWQALAYARSRYAPGETDFTRAARQQEVLLAIRTKLMRDGSLLANLPSLLSAFAGLVTTDLPTSRLPDLAAIADGMGSDSIYRMVLNHPLVKPNNDPVYGSTQLPDLPAIRAAVAAIMPSPGGIPVPWSSSKPSPVRTAAPTAP
jgi:LCP family protein required for cell wall assembly